MIIAKNLLRSETADWQIWKEALLHHRKKPEFYVMVIHAEHVYPMEIMTSKEFMKADADDIRYRVVGLAESYGACLKLFKTAVDEVMKRDPELTQLKVILQEIYI